MKQSTQITDSRRVFEIIAVFLTGIGKFVFMDLLNQRLPFIISIIVFWVIYVVVRRKQNPEILKLWGFRKDNFFRVWKIVLPFGLAAVLLFILIGAWRNTLNITWHLIPILILYPTWGLIQQFLVISLVGGNMHTMEEKKFSKPFVLIITAILFGVLHFPYWWLVAGTFVLALFYGYVFLKERNLYVLGLFHGWLGGLFFYTVVDRDPFVEVFGGLLNL